MSIQHTGTSHLHNQLGGKGLFSITESYSERCHAQLRRNPDLY